MRRRQLHPTCPETWFFTDPRLGDGLWGALDRLPSGSGIVVRHYDLPRTERAALIGRIRTIARRRRLILVVAGSAQDALRLRADGIHHPTHAPKRSASLPQPRLVTAAAHNRAELVAARRAGASLVFLSPVFPTRSHPGARTLGPVRFGLLAREAGVAVAALGGMTARRHRRLRRFGAIGWGAIDAWASPNVRS